MDLISNFYLFISPAPLLGTRRASMCLLCKMASEKYHSKACKQRRPVARCRANSKIQGGNYFHGDPVSLGDERRVNFVLQGSRKAPGQVT